MNEFLYVFRGGMSGEMSPKEMEASMNKWRNWLGQLSKEGKLKDGGNPLKSQGSVVRANGMVTDGPYADGKEIIGGYIVVQAEDLAEATELSKGCPTFDTGGNVEIRPVASM